MKDKVLIFLVSVAAWSMISLTATSLLAGEGAAPEWQNVSVSDFQRPGFRTGGEASAYLNDELPFGFKLDLISGYRFNPYLSLNADLWTFLFALDLGTYFLAACGAEINPRVHLGNTRGRVEPFLTGSTGIAVVPLTGDTALTYTGGLGIDINVKERTVLTLIGKYRGMNDWSPGGLDDTLSGAMELGVGFRVTF